MFTGLLFKSMEGMQSSSEFTLTVFSLATLDTVFCNGACQNNWFGRGSKKVVIWPRKNFKSKVVRLSVSSLSFSLHLAPNKLLNNELYRWENMTVTLIGIPAASETIICLIQMRNERNTEKTLTPSLWCQMRTYFNCRTMSYITVFFHQANIWMNKLKWHFEPHKEKNYYKADWCTL